MLTATTNMVYLTVISALIRFYLCTEYHFLKWPWYPIMRNGLGVVLRHQMQDESSAEERNKPDNKCLCNFLCFVQCVVILNCQ